MPKLSVLFWSGVLALAQAAFAGTVVSVTGKPDTAFYLRGETEEAVMVTSWTPTVEYSNVSIAVDVGDRSTGSLIAAYLTNAIGSAEPSATLNTSFTFDPATPNEFDTIFGGLTLVPGAYYMGPNVSFTGSNDVNLTNPPGSNFAQGRASRLFFPVTGDTAAIPGLGFISVIVADGLGRLWLWKRRRIG